MRICGLQSVMLLVHSIFVPFYNVCMHVQPNLHLNVQDAFQKRLTLHHLVLLPPMANDCQLAELVASTLKRLLLLQSRGCLLSCGIDALCTLVLLQSNACNVTYPCQVNPQCHVTPVCKGVASNFLQEAKQIYSVWTTNIIRFVRHGRRRN